MRATAREAARLAAAGVLLAGAACGGAEDSAGSGAEASGPAAGPVDTASAADDPFAGDSRPLRDYRLLLVNGTDAPVEVSADAGAGAVRVDTVSAADSVGVVLRTRASNVVLEAVRSGRGELARRAVDLGGVSDDSVVRWEIGGG